MTGRTTLSTARSGLLGGALLMGCAGSRREFFAPCNVVSALGQYALWEQLGPDQLDAAYGQAQRSFERSGRDCDRLRIAALTVLQSSRKNEAHAREILGSDLDTNKGSGGPPASLARPPARVLRERVEADARSRVALRKTTDDQVRADACKRQLEELRNVETIIDERRLP